MTITNQRLLEGIGQALQSLGAAATDPFAKGMAQAAAIAVDELRSRDNTDAVRERYRSGHALTGALLAKLENPDEKLRAAFAALPAQIDAEASWKACANGMEALLDVAERLSHAHFQNTEKVQDALRALKDLLDWEAEGYRFTRSAASQTAAPAFTQEAVETFIRGSSDAYRDASITSFNPLNGGFSKQTILLDVTTAAHGKEGFVLRGQPAVKVLGLRGQEIDREFHLLRYAHANGIRCAQPVWLFEDAKHPYSISRRLPGRNVGDGIQGNQDISDGLAKSLAGVMAAIHALPIDQAHPDIASSHLALKQPQSRQQAQRQFMQEWIDVWRHQVKRKSPVVATTIQWVMDNVPDDPRPAALVHCDCGFNNMLVDNDEVSAMLDWEISHLGDPAEDISWLMFNLPNPETQKRFMHHYLAAGGEAFDAFRLKYYDVVASLKMLIAMNDIGEKFQTEPSAGIQLCAYALPYLQVPAATVGKLIEEAERLR